MILFSRTSERKETRKFTRVFYATDIHGSELCFRKFLNADDTYKCDVVILGGDITGKMIVPIVEQPNGGLQCEFLGQNLTMSTDEDLKQTETKIMDTGYYGYRTTWKEMNDLQSNPSKVDEIFKQLVADRLARWVKTAEDRFRDKPTRCFMTGGNDDFFLIEDILNNSDVVVNPEGKVVRVDEHHEMIGSGYCNMTPWQCPRDISDDELSKKIEELIPKVEDMKNCIFCFHAPPKDSGLDSCPMVDSSVYPPKIVVGSGGQPIYVGAGSLAVRNAIEKHQPLMGLHGHIHESRGVAKLGRTLCTNPGSEYSEGILRGAILNITKEKLISYQLTSG